MRTFQDLVCRMRDGTVLRHDLYLPDGEGACPVILLRTPYGKRHFSMERIYADYAALVDGGYAVAVQDVRGTGASDGELLSTGENEFGDGYDTVEALASMSFCNGRVGMYGLSYFGFTQLAAAALAPKALRCICPFENAALAPFSGCAQRTIGGHHLYWLYGQAIARLPRMGFTPEKEAELKARLLENQANLPVLLKHLPLRETPAADIAEIPLLRQYVELVDGIEDDAFWARIRRPVDFTGMTTPMLHLTGWFDVALNGTLDNYLEACAYAKESCKDNQWLVIGPWCHGGMLEGTLEGQDFGHDADGLVFDVPGLMKKFFDAFVKDRPEALLKVPRVQYFQLGENIWRSAQAWPPLESVQRCLYLTPEGGLADRPCMTGGKVSYDYNPLDPYPSDVTDDTGRRLMADRRSLYHRPDQVSFRMDAKTTPLRLAGRLNMRLYAETSAVDTDFVCIVSVEAPDGAVRQLACGLARGRFRHGSMPQPIEPGVCEAFDIDVGNIAYTLPAGHALLVTITSSYYPLHNVNLNDGLPAGRGTRPVLAKQTIWMDADHPSVLYIPVLP